MGCAEIISLAEVRARKQWDSLRHQLHARFDEWLDGLEEQLSEPEAPLATVTETVWGYPPDLYLQVDAGIPTRQVPYPAHLVVVEPPMCSAAGTAQGFFPQRWSCTTRTFRSPKTP